MSRHFRHSKPPLHHLLFCHKLQLVTYYATLKIVSWHICLQCRQEFYRKGRGPASFCSIKCRSQARTGKPSPHKPAKGNSFGKGGYRPDLKAYFRSRWEANYARYLKYLNCSFVYEPDKFLIELPDGSRHYYHPDFLVDNAYYVEIKGWERADRRQSEVIKAAQFQLPLPLYIIRTSQYRFLERTIAKKIKHWEYRGDNLPKPERFCPICRKRITSIFRRTKFCSIKCYAISRSKDDIQPFIEGGKKTRFKLGHKLGSIGGKASAEAHRKRKMLI